MRCVFILFVTLFCSAAAWDDGDFEVFDVVEEVNQNFYELMGVSQDASPQEIKSAFKKLTLKLHPDKNDSPDADVQFRNLVSVHNVLKDPGKREKYNDVLKNGLPNWRSAVYYYRHVRKMGLAEGSLILFVIITLGQYAVGWAAYAEKRFTAEQILNSRGKKHTKKSGFDTGLAEILEQLPRPSVRDTLPFQLPRLLWAAALAVPRAAVALRAHHAEQKILAAKLKKKEEEEAAAAEAAAAAAAAGKGARRRRTFVPPAREAGGAGCAGGAAPRGPSPAREAGARAEPVVAGGLWTDEDLSELARLVRRWPAGTPERWALVARALRRPVPEVTLVAARLKAGAYRLPAPDEPAPPPPARKVKTRRAEEPAAAAAPWAQAQQAALEAALARHPKGGAGDRWDKIAASVPGKTKEECMQRCKYLSEMLRKQKQKEEEDKREQEKESPEITDEAEPLLST